MKRMVPILTVVLLVALLSTVAFVTHAYAKKPGGGGGGCPRDILCYDLWDPVICSDGQIYSNDCYAYRACATGCQPAGGGPVPVLEAKKPKPNCPRDILCYDLWDPVICSDGQVYSNDCYAYRECATGCVPYGEGGPIPAMDPFESTE